MTTSLQAWESITKASDGDVPAWQTDPTHPFWYDNDIAPMGGNSTQTDEGALRVAAFLACVRVLGESISGLPCKLFQRLDDGKRSVATQHGQYYTLHDSPDGLMTAQEFWELVTTKMILRGNFPARMQSSSSGPNTIIKWIDPDRHSRTPPITEMSDGSWRFYYKDEDDDEVYLSTARNDFLHFKGMTLDGMWGMSPLTMLRLQLESADKARKWGTEFFDNGMAPSGVFQSEKELSDKGYARLRAQVREKSGYKRAHESLILEDGLKYEPIAMSHSDAQFLELRKFDKAEIAGVMRVPLHMIQELDRSTNNNIEHQSLEFVIHTLRPWLRRIEDALKLRFILRPGTFYAEFLIDALLRGDTKSRYEAYSSAITNLWMSPDEVREKENMNPRPDGKGGEFKNPAINPEQAKPSPDSSRRAQIHDQQPMRRQIGVFAKDASSRVALAAYDGLKDRVQKHAHADPDRFNAWATDWFVNHAKYVDKVISPFCEAFDVQQAHKAECVERIILESGKRLKSDPTAGLEWIATDGAGTFERFFTELVT